MQASSSNTNQDLSFLQCYICFQNVKKPRMCPSCSKLACQNCLRTWIQESKSQCPHCRKPLLLGSFADCERFVNDIKHLISNIDNNEKLKEKCTDHKIQMQYYCEDCKDPICSDCGMFGKHRGHQIIHLNTIYQENKNRILNELAKFDNKIELFRKNAYFIKMQMQKLIIQIGQKKSFIQEYFVALIERLDEEYKEKKEKVEAKYDGNVQEIEFLETFRDNICQELECKSEKELITKSEDFITYIKNLCEREADFEEEEYSFDTIHQLVPKYKKFTYKMEHYKQQTESIVYSQPYEINGIQWRLKIYPKGNGVAKNSHISVFLEMSKGYINENKYEYKIQLINHLNSKDSVVREYSSKFDIGECWGYNQFIPLVDLENGFLNQEDALQFIVNVRNPSYRSLVRDQENYIQILENKVNCKEASPNVGMRREKMNELAEEIKGVKAEFRSLLYEGENNIPGINQLEINEIDDEDEEIKAIEQLEIERMSQHSNESWEEQRNSNPHPNPNNNRSMI